MKVLIDTNILIDFLAKREPFYSNAYKLFHLCISEDIEGYVAAHSIMNTFYILRKDYSVQERRKMLLSIIKIFTVVGIDKDKIITSLQNDDFFDVEDCLQLECAKEVNAQYIISRNINDFMKSSIPCISPELFLSRL